MNIPSIIVLSENPQDEFLFHFLIRFTDDNPFITSEIKRIVEITERAQFEFKHRRIILLRFVLSRLFLSVSRELRSGVTVFQNLTELCFLQIGNNRF